MTPDGLLDYQVEIAATGLEILKRHRALLDASETGVGKTYVGMAIARECGIKPLVICPKAVKSAWHKVAAHLGGECFTANYESLKGDLTEWGIMHRPPNLDEAKAAFEAKQEEMRTASSGMEQLSIQLEKLRKSYKLLKSAVRYEWAPGIPLIEFDEVQKCKSQTSLNSKMLIAAKRQGIPVIMSSATPAQSPLEMKALGFALGLHNGVEFWRWCQRNGCHPGRFAPLVFTGGDVALKRINSQIFPDRGIRITRESLGSKFPETQITAELYDLEKQETKIDALYAEMSSHLTALREKSAADLDLEHPLTQLLRKRQELELVKVPLFVSLIEQHLEVGMSVAVFVNFSGTIAAIRERFPADMPIGTISGMESDKQRGEMLEKFQRGECKLELCNLQAGGVGINMHDETGRHPRIALISPTFSALDLVQVLGRVHRQGGHKSIQRIVLAAGTVEEKIHKKLSQKLNNISLITDGDLQTLL